MHGGGEGGEGSAGGKGIAGGEHIPQVAGHSCWMV